jgi:hypothetical protein
MKKNVASSLILVGKILTVLSFSTTAMAVVGSNFVKGLGGNPATCRIISRDAQGTLLSICSGSLVAEDKVLTTTLCETPEMDTVEVQCGFTGLDRPNMSLEYTQKGTSVITKGILFLEETEGTYTYFDRENDQAVLTLSDSLSIKPLKVRSNYVIMPNDICHIEGYGRTNDGYAGILYSGAMKNIGPNLAGNTLADTTRIIVRKAPGQASAYENIHTMPESSIMTDGMTSVIGRRGDAGAPIICQRGNEYNVVAVWARVRREGQKDPTMQTHNPQNFELVLHTSFSKLIKPKTLTHIFNDKKQQGSSDPLVY